MFVLSRTLRRHPDNFRKEQQQKRIPIQRPAYKDPLALLDGSSLEAAMWLLRPVSVDPVERPARDRERLLEGRDLATLGVDG